MTDAELINLIIEGDNSLFDILIRKWQNPIYNFALRYLGSADLAFDITQKTFLRVYENIRKLKEADRFSPWIYRIAANLCMDELKKMNRQNILSLDHIQEDNVTKGKQLPDCLIIPAQKEPDARMNKKQVTSLVRKALGLLPDEQRIVIIMKEYQGLKFREIADALDEPLSTVKSRMYYGLKALRDVFKNWKITEEVLNNEM